MKALQDLFDLQPYTNLARGINATVYAHPIGISMKDDMEHLKVDYEGDEATYEKVLALAGQILPAEDYATLDVSVGGKEFALSTMPVMHQGARHLELVVAARHRLSRQASADFNATVAIPSPTVKRRKPDCHEHDKDGV